MNKKLVQQEALHNTSGKHAYGGNCLERFFGCFLGRSVQQINKPDIYTLSQDRIDREKRIGVNRSLFSRTGQVIEVGVFIGKVASVMMVPAVATTALTYITGGYALMMITKQLVGREPQSALKFIAKVAICLAAGYILYAGLAASMGSFIIEKTGSVGSFAETKLSQFGTELAANCPKEVMQYVNIGIEILSKYFQQVVALTPPEVGAYLKQASSMIPSLSTVSKYPQQIGLMAIALTTGYLFKGTLSKR